MARFHPAWLEHRRRRFTRPDGHRWIRPDGQRYLKPKPYERKDSPPPDDAGPDLAARKLSPAALYPRSSTPSWRVTRSMRR